MKLRYTRGFTLIELLIVVAIIGIIAAIAVPGLLRARMAGNEASAIGTLRAINSGEATFASTCGLGSYADTLAGLYAPPPRGPRFVAPDLAYDGIAKSGYTFGIVPDGDGVPVYQPAACNNTSMTTAYFVDATPVTVGSSGQRAFATNTSNTIFWSPDGSQKLTGPTATIPLP